MPLRQVPTRRGLPHQKPLPPLPTRHQFIIWLRVLQQLPHWDIFKHHRDHHVLPLHVLAGLLLLKGLQFLQRGGVS